MPLNHSRFETEMDVRPDDIDMNRHVHSSRYFDYVLAARYDQMARCYGMPMEEFITMGFSWVIRAARIEYKRPLGLGDRFIVRTWIEELAASGVSVCFEILRADNRKLCSDGRIDYTMVSAATRRAAQIPEWIIERYSI